MLLVPSSSRKYNKLIFLGTNITHHSHHCLCPKLASVILSITLLNLQPIFIVSFLHQACPSCLQDTSKNLLTNAILNHSQRFTTFVLNFICHLLTLQIMTMRRIIPLFGYSSTPWLIISAALTFEHSWSHHVVENATSLFF